MDRRTFLKKSGAIAMTLPLAQACGTEPAADAPLPVYDYDGPLGPEDTFTHGVASGDPWDDSVLLWTRVAPEVSDGAVVFWEVATDVEFNDRVAAGEEAIQAERDGTLKVIAERLAPSTSYYYRFWLLGRSSPIGRTRTTGAQDHVRLAFCSCANYASGLFVSYRGLAARPDMDAVIHLGDYIYESQYGSGTRPNKPPYEVVTLSDYRIRYAHYRSDPDLQEVHRQHPFICVWDDHETANNSYKDGASNHDPDDGEGTWEDRRAAATQAWREWLPVRDTPDGRIWRRNTWGKLVDLFMLDTRLWARAKQVTPGQKDKINDPDRPFLGTDQEKWLHEGLVTGGGRWKVLGQQVMLAPLKVNGSVLNTDQWDGYEATRNRLFDVIRDKSVDGLVVLTGDIHTSWANDLTPDSTDAALYDPKTGKGALGVEFVTPGVTSGGFGGGAAALGEIAKEFNAHIRWADLTNRGYCVLDLTNERAQCDWYHYASLKDDAQEKLGASWLTLHGSGHLTPADGEAAAKSESAPLAPSV